MSYREVPPGALICRGEFFRVCLRDSRSQEQEKLIDALHLLQSFSAEVHIFPQLLSVTPVFGQGLKPQGRSDGENRGRSVLLLTATLLDCCHRVVQFSPLETMQTNLAFYQPLLSTARCWLVSSGDCALWRFSPFLRFIDLRSPAVL